MKRHNKSWFAMALSSKWLRTFGEDKGHTVAELFRHGENRAHKMSHIRSIAASNLMPLLDVVFLIILARPPAAN
jgi:hypothetical protein